MELLLKRLSLLVRTTRRDNKSSIVGAKLIWVANEVCAPGQVNRATDARAECSVVSTEIAARGVA
jgi:hypothetical protein